MIALALAAALVVIDGDSLKAGAESLRLKGVDAPEIAHARCLAERRLGEAARRQLAAMAAAARRAEIERFGRDRYGRTLARIAFDGADAGETLVAAGLARPWPSAHGWCSPL